MGSLPDILQCIFTGLADGSIYAIVAIGFTIIFSSTQVVNFAQGEFVMLGAMLSFVFCGAHSEWGASGLGWPIWLGVPLAAVIALVVGSILGWIIMRPLKESSVVTLIIITIGASMLMQGVASHLWGKDPVPVPPFTNAGTLVFFLPQSWTGHANANPVVIDPQRLWVMGLAAAMMIGLTLFFSRTMAGKALRAVAANRHGARLVGVNVGRMVVSAFALSAVIGAVAGAAIAPISSGSYNMGVMIGLKGFAAAIVGGLGSFPGSILAGLLLGILENFGAFYISSEYKDALSFIILLVVLFISPNGLLALFRRRVKA